MFQHNRFPDTDLGERDAVLADPPMTTEHTGRVIKWDRRSGKTLKYISSSLMGTGDHLGFASQQARSSISQTSRSRRAEHDRRHALTPSPEVRARLGIKQFPNWIPEAPVVATARLATCV